jgi:hypothetical protein
VGRESLRNNSTGGNNNAVGYSALRYNTTGNNNNSFGYASLYYNTTGTSLAAFGHNALNANTTASNNSAFGRSAGGAITTGSENTAVGAYALDANTTGGNNVAIGYDAAGALTGGGDVVCIGKSAGDTITGGGNSVISGSLADASGANVSNEIVIGYNSTGKGASTGFINANGGANYAGNNSASWSTTSDRRIKKNIKDNKTGLDKINDIRVRNFEYRLPEEVDEELPQSAAIDREGIQLGVIAQEIMEILPDVVKQESTGCYTVDPDNLTWYLVNAVKELSAEVEQLKQKKNNNGE